MRMGEIICQYRQIRKMTQDEFAFRLGVTPQAVSKWERGAGLPDISLVEGICRILGISANALLGMDVDFAEKGYFKDEREIKSNLVAEPLELLFGKGLVSCVVEGLETDYINAKRKELAKETGKLIPVLRLRDDLGLGEKEYQVRVYDRVVYEQQVDGADAYKNMIDGVVKVCKENYAAIINKQIVKFMIDAVKEHFPGVADGLIPERISYLQVERELQKKLEKEGSLRDVIHIIEDMEERLFPRAIRQD